MGDINKRQLIVQVAKDCFQDFGYKATTVEQITKNVMIAKGAFYLFFQSKEELLRYITEKEIQRVTGDMDRILRKEPVTVDFLHEYICHMLSYKNDNPLFNRLAAEAKLFRTLEVVDSLHHIETHIFLQIKRLLRSLVEAETIHLENTEMAAFLLMKNYIALLYTWGEEHGPISKEQAITIVRQLFDTMLI